MADSPFQILPPPSPEEYAQLEDSIKRQGVLQPIIKDEHGHIIDGHTRDEIARRLGKRCPSTTIGAGRTDTEKRSMALAVNIERRQLTTEQKRALVTTCLKADPQLSDREHGRRCGVSPSTVGAIRSELEESVQIGHFPTHTDPRTGNQSQPARKKQPAQKKQEDEAMPPAPIPIMRKKGPQRSKARAIARNSLVSAAIALTTAARQLNSIVVDDLEFTPADQELDQAPTIIADAVKTINATLREVKQHEQHTRSA